ncbi:hypothetical protein [Mycolicibacterium mageritense]|uniref:hypothetical protein n=1 Tax=Mycolicibacterium mageritense TaxID=53462 RepID=UPI0011D49753|nr:hypothetical protein [Mycolicibacterium mageritense]TXI62928.1 MAG: hypothetical protein E6Q55_11250 [Mycolicibacterium mageritense]
MAQDAQRRQQTASCAEDGAIELDAVDFTPWNNTSVLDKPGVVYSALSAGGIAATAIQAFTEATELIVGKESVWQTNAVAVLSDGRAMADGAPLPAQRGLTQLSPWAFAQYHVAGTSVCIYDPVANIAAAWRLVSAVYGVDLRTGHGLDEFVAKIRAQPGTWFGSVR